MKNKDLILIGGLLGAIYFFKNQIDKSTPIEDAVGSSGFSTTGSNEWALPDKSQSELTPNHINIREGNTIYNIDYGTLTGYEQFLIKNDAFEIDSEGKLKKQPLKLFTNPILDAIGSAKQSTFTNSAGVIQQQTQTSKDIKIRTTKDIGPNLVVTIPKKEQSTLNPTKTNIRTINSNSGQVTTYQGNAVQVAVGKTIDKAKSLLSSVFKK